MNNQNLIGIIFQVENKNIFLFLCNNVTSGEFLKRKSRNNNYPKLHPSQFDLLRNASPSRAPIWSRNTFSPYTLVSLHTRLPTHLSLYALIFLRTCLPTYSSPYTLVSLHTRLSTHSSYRYIRIPAGSTFRLGIYLRSSTCRGHLRSS